MRLQNIKRYCTGFVACSLLISLFISSISFAQQAPPASFGTSRGRTTAQQRLQTRITYSCRDLDIDTVLMQLAEQAKIDIIKSPKVKGNVTVKVTDVPLEEALNNILAAHGYTFIATENMIRVVPTVEIVTAREKEVTKIYRINYANFEEVARGLARFISKKGRVVGNKGTNSLMITDIESNVKAIDKFIDEIDRITPQVLVEVRIYDVTSNEAFEIGTYFHAYRNTPLKSFNTTKSYKRTDTVTSPKHYTERELTYSDPNHWDLSDAELSVIKPSEIEYKKYDTPELSGYGIENKDESTEKGNSWLQDNSGDQLPYRRSKPFYGGQFDPSTGAGAIQFSLMNDMVDMTIILNLLQSQTDAKLLANPRVLVLDNETAYFKIVTEIPYKEQSQTSAGGQMTSTKFKEVGVELNVTPHIIIDKNLLRLHVKPKFGVAGPQTRNPVTGDLEVPSVNTREVETTALLKSGQTIVLAGLRKKDLKKFVSKVPLLGDIPLLGNLFRSKTEKETSTELVIFITPKIITSTILTDAEQKHLQATEFTMPEIGELEKKTGHSE